MFVKNLHILFFLCIIYPSMQKFNAGITRPTCHPGILVLFNWCEQSDCQRNCTCETEKVCKQICEQNECGSLYCNSSSTCHQSVLTNRYVRQPTVREMYSTSPITQQDCSEGHCAVLSAKKYKDKMTKVFQSCSEGKCGVLKSNAHQVKQFCDNCDKMSCYGNATGNCTQLCIIGNCKKVKCTSTNCKQLCSHGSHCNLECSENVETCRQECIHGSTCNLNCRAKSCTMICDDASTCTITKNKTMSTTIKPTSNYIRRTTSAKQTTILKTLFSDMKTSTLKKTFKPVRTTTGKPSSTASTTTLSNEVEIPQNNHVDSIDDVLMLQNNSIVTAMNLQYKYSNSNLLKANYFQFFLVIFISLFVICLLS